MSADEAVGEELQLNYTGSISTNQPIHGRLTLWPWERYGLSFEWNWMDEPFGSLPRLQVEKQLEVREGDVYWLKGKEVLRLIEVDGKLLVLCLYKKN